MTCLKAKLVLYLFCKKTPFISYKKNHQSTIKVQTNNIRTYNSITIKIRKIFKQNSCSHSK